MKIALVQLGINKMYYDLCDAYYFVNKENFFPDEEVDFYIFTNVQPTVARKGQYVFVKDYEGPWPEPAFRKFECVLEAIENKDYDYVFYLDADDYFLSGALFRKEFIENDFSIISPVCWDAKYGGMFWGGKTEYVKDMCSCLKKRSESILQGREFPHKENEEQLLLWLDDVKFNVVKYPYGEVFFEKGKKWLYQIQKNFRQAHDHKRYVDYGFVKGYAGINLSMKLIAIHEATSHCIYGHLEELAEGVYEITWENPRFPNSLLDLRK
jgi:hypothetical protein